MKVAVQFIKILLLAVFLVGCGERGTSPTGFTGGDTPEELVGVDWELESFEIDGDVDPVNDGKLYTLTVRPDSTASGFADCNLYGGPVVFDEQNFRFLQIASTRALCTSPSRGAEFLSALELARRYEIQDGRLRILYDNGPKVLHFRPYQP